MGPYASLVACCAALSGCGRIAFDASPIHDGDSDAPIVDTAPLAYEQAVRDDHPLAYWRLGESNTSQDQAAIDTVGSFDGVYQAGSTSVAGALADDPDAAAKFDGTSGAVVVATSEPLAFSGRQPLSVELWANLPNTAYGHLVTEEPRIGTLPVNGYAVLQSSTIQFERAVTGANPVVVSSPTRTITLNQWTHIVGVYDGSTLALYLDGEAVGTPTADVRPMQTYTSPLYIGTHPGGAYITGSIDEVAIYNYALPLARIQLHHTLGLQGASGL